MSGVEVRPATVADAAGIARVHVQSWRETYTHLVEPGELDALDIEARERRWAGLIAGDEVQVWVAALDSAVVGWASTGRGRGGDAPRPLELEGIYLLAAQHGSSAGQELLDAAIGDVPAFLWVADHNPRATAFYRRNRFEFDGARQTHPLVRTPIVVRRMVR
ncbi:GNAT family N-acetyltransferase [Lysinimonas soli]|uniref:GNAT family N-acetyltransferase n=1 Tax=Lysinimonas soli TaxID=1074233 RepID=A0ABW0NNR5_9MICO